MNSIHQCCTDHSIVLESEYPVFHSRSSQLVLDMEAQKRTGREDVLADYSTPTVASM